MLAKVSCYNGFYQKFCMRKAVPPDLTLKPDNSVPSAFWAIAPGLELRASESISKSICKPFKRNGWDFSTSASHWATISAVFHSQTCLPSTGTLDSSAQYGGRTPCSSGETATANTPLASWLPHVDMGSYLYPSFQSQYGFFCISLVINLCPSSLQVVPKDGCSVV